MMVWAEKDSGSTGVQRSAVKYSVFPFSAGGFRVEQQTIFLHQSAGLPALEEVAEALRAHEAPEISLGG